MSRVLSFPPPRDRDAAVLEPQVAAMIEEAREVGSEGASEAFDQGIEPRLRAMLRLTPGEFECSASVLPRQVIALQAELTELKTLVATRDPALGLVAFWRMRWSARRRMRHIVVDIAAVRAQVLRDERSRDQLDQWVATRADMIRSEYRHHQHRAERVASEARAHRQSAAADGRVVPHFDLAAAPAATV